MHIIKRILFIFTALLCILLASGCEKERGVKYTLTYTAGENGSIAGTRSQKVNHGGTGKVVTARPAEGYHFVAWSDGVDSASRTDSNVTADISVTAGFAINRYILTYTAAENGTVDGVSPQTVEHGGDGSLVTAIPAEHYHFVAWSDGAATASRTDSDVTADISVTANFAIDQYMLTYTAGENGTIEGVSPQKVDHGGIGKAVKAKPAAGYHFTGWSDGAATASRTDSDVTADISVTANFALNKYTLTYSAAENGTIDGVSPQTVEHGGDGSPVTAIPAEHYHFVAWSDGAATASRTDSDVIADISVTANFAIDQYTLTYTAGEIGTIEGAKSQKVSHGGAGSMVTAKPPTGYHFVSWSDGVTSPQRIDSKVTTDITVTANFAINQYTLAYAAEENGTIDGINPQTVDHGADGSLVTAVANKGYHFVTWSDGLIFAERIDSKVTGGITVSAIFEINTYTVGGSVSGLVEGTQLVLQNKENDDLVITVNGDFKFTTELPNTTTYEVRVLTQPTSPNQTCTVSGGTGTISAENVNNILVTCILNTYSIGGTVFGIPDGDEVVLQNNGRNNLILRANGFFSFDTPLDDGSEYEVTVYSQPKRPNWTCELENAAGSLAGMDVTNIIVDCFPEVVLQATAGIRKVKLVWNSYDFEAEVTFNLCLAQDKILPGGFRSCQDLKGGSFETKVNSPLTFSQLINDIPYWFQLEARYKSGRQTLSEVVKATPFGGLNDSGIDWCSDNEKNHNVDGTRPEKTESCEALAESHPGQDAFHGRDALARARKLAKTGTGSAGFDFTKLCMSGEVAAEGECPPNPLPGRNSNNWACTRDNVTGLTWEIKTESGLRSKNNTYTWYNPDETVNGGGTGSENGGKCEGSNCDTHAYVQVINESGLCGVSDWRLPTKKELLSIVDNGHFKPAVDIRFFLNTLSSHYWTSSPYPEEENSAWQVYFLYGEVSPNNKNQSNNVRLVRGRTVTFGLDNP